MLQNHDMNLQELLQLITQEESPTLEFKQEWYIDEDKSQGKLKKNEMVRDILSLANGNASTAGQDAYLILGAADKKDEEGHRELFDIPGEVWSSAKILDKVNSFCQPPVPDLYVQDFVINEERLHAITIPFSAHLHETTKILERPHKNGKRQKNVPKYTVLIRHNDRVGSATEQERIALREMKAFHAQEKVGVRPMFFGTAVSTLVSALLGLGLGDEINSNLPPAYANLLAFFIMGFIGGGLGFLLSSYFVGLRQVRREWHQYLVIQKAIWVVFLILAVLIGGYILFQEYLMA